jgi:hypothetical protein
MASTRISLIRGLQGEKGDIGDPGPAGPNTVPTQQAVADALTTPGSAAEEALTAKYTARHFDRPAVSTPDMDMYRALGAAVPLTTPTPDGSGQATHPDVKFFPEGFAGYQWWMVYTPYPNMSDPAENPCVMQSTDGVTWTAPAGLTNPIEPYPGGSDYNSDAILVKHGDTLYCIFRQVIAAKERLVWKSTTDGVTWTAKQTMLTTDTLTAVLSPAITFNGTEYVMFCVSGAAIPRVITRRTAPHPTGPWSAAQSGTISLPPSRFGGGLPQNPWHIDVEYRDGRYTALIDCKTGNAGDNGGLGDLVFASSFDGLTWKAASGVAVIRSEAGWDASFYRSSIVPLANGGWRIYYSGITADSLTWRIGVTETLPGAVMAKGDTLALGKPHVPTGLVSIRSKDAGPLPILDLRRFSPSQVGKLMEFRNESGDILYVDWSAIGGGLKLSNYAGNGGTKVGDEGLGVNGPGDFLKDVWLSGTVSNLRLGPAADPRSASRAIAMQNANATPPTSNPSSGGVMYAEDGVPMWRTQNGAIARLGGDVVAMTANGTIGVHPRVVLATGGASGIALKLPSVRKGLVVTVKKVDSGAGAVTVNPNVAETIEGVANKILTAQYQSADFVCDGTNWFLV